MSKRKDDSPFAGGTAYSDILGVDPDRIKRKVRQGGLDRSNLLNSNDLFGDIIEDLQNDSLESAPSAPSAKISGPSTSSQDPRAEAVPEAQPVQPLTREGPAPEDAPPSEAPASLLEAAYSTLLEDRSLDLDAPSPEKAGEKTLEYGSYVLLDRIAMGGMAEVFRAKRTGVEGFEKVVAVKRILPHLSNNSEFVAMFVAEAKMVASLTHPNIAQIFDLGKIDDTYYIAMELVEGHDLRTILTRARMFETQMGVDLAAVIAARVCSALEYAHRHRDSDGVELRIVHRDVSPQNILVSSEGEVKLVDFGIARAASKASHTDSGSLRGKLLYMSPEQAWGKPLDNRSDIFSLGSVFFEALTGRPLFSGASDMSILERVREAKIVTPSSLNPAVPIELEAVVTRALQRDPSARYQDASEMLLDLDTYLRRRPAVGPATLASFIQELFEREPPA